MVENLISKGKKILISPQSTILSAASIIMIMIVASRLLGLVRQRTLAHFFIPDDISLFFAAFRLPDTVFEVLVFGTFSSAFIPVFTKSLKKGEKAAWNTAGIVANIGIVAFAALAFTASVTADSIYTIFTPGYSPEQITMIVKITRVLFAAQGFFVVSYVLTGVLESLRRFLVPALAPLFYNLGIIFGTIFLSGKYGLMAPAYGVLIGAFMHFMIQLPLAVKLGFRFVGRIRPNAEVREIGKLALPRVIEVTFVQISKIVELSLASIISTASYTYFSFANSLQLLPVGLFGTSIAKAALPTLSRQADDKVLFKKTLILALSQMTFLVLPISTILIVLRIPIVRLAFGTEIFGWEATVQTGIVASVFAFSAVFQAGSALLARSFYALNDTRTPVKVSVTSLIIVVATDLILVRGLGFPTWGLAAGFALGSFYQATTLYILINKRLGKDSYFGQISVFAKSTFAAVLSGASMYVLLKFFDRSVWVKRLGLLPNLELTKNLPFENFVLDTRYTANLLLLTISVSVIGIVIYLTTSVLLKINEAWVFFDLVKRIFVKRKFAPIPAKESEPVSPTPEDGVS
jgi:putative peptidoglycan lipid II flippase